jgi:hypothetical protein
MSEAILGILLITHSAFSNSRFIGNKLRPIFDEITLVIKFCPLKQ